MGAYSVLGIEIKKIHDTGCLIYSFINDFVFYGLRNGAYRNYNFIFWAVAILLYMTYSFQNNEKILQ